MRGRGRGCRLAEHAPILAYDGGARGNGRGYALRENGGVQEPMNGQRELKEVRAGENSKKNGPYPDRLVQYSQLTLTYFSNTYGKKWDIGIFWLIF